MKRSVRVPKDILAVCVVSAFLLLYCTLLRFESTVNIALVMFLFAPFLLAWMVLTVLINGKYEGPDLGENEFGYQDKKKEDLGIF